MSAIDIDIPINLKNQVSVGTGKCLSNRYLKVGFILTLHLIVVSRHVQIITFHILYISNFFKQATI